MKENKENLIQEAEKNNVFFEEIQNETCCEFLDCEKNAILHVEDFDVCFSHGIKLIHCFVDKLNKGD